MVQKLKGIIIDGGETMLKVRPSYTTEKVKKMIFKKNAAILVHTQKLVSKGKIMEDYAELHHYGIQKDPTIYLVPKEIYKNCFCFAFSF